MYSDVEYFVRACEDCQTRKNPPKKLRAPLIPIEISEAFEYVAIDCIGPLPKSDQSNKYIVCITDLMTKWPEAFAVPSIDAIIIARLLHDEIIARHGCPRVILSDQARNFRAKLVKALYKVCNITKSTTTAYHPQCNGLCERFNATLVTCLSKFVNSQQTDWDEYIPAVLFAYRTTPCTESTQFSPFYLLYGRHPVLPMDASLIKPTDATKSADVHLQRVIQRLEVAQEIAKEKR